MKNYIYREKIIDYLLSAFFCGLIFIIFLSLDTKLLHWSSFFALACGLLISPDLIEWVRNKKKQIFDPNFFVALVIFVAYFFSPLLFLLYQDKASVGRVELINPKYWVGLTCILYLTGLIFYKIGYFIGIKFKIHPKYVWKLSRNRFLLFALFIILLQFICQIIFVTAMGGFSGWINLKTYGGNIVPIKGLGPIMVVGRSLPIVLAILITYITTKFSNERKQNLIKTNIFFIVIMFIQILFTGLSGSRNSIIYSCLWFVFLIHYYWRPVSKKSISILFIFFLIFMYFYGFYKSLGLEAYNIYMEKKGLNSVKKIAKDRNIYSLIVGDFSRVDVNAAQIYILRKKPWEYRLRNGTTYLDGVIPLIPRMLWKTKSPDSGKVIAGTEMLYGPHSYEQRGKIWRYGKGFRSTKIYGLLGEWLLNYGLFFHIIPFLIVGVVVGIFHSIYKILRKDDVRTVLLPVGIILCFCMIINDFSNHFAYILYSAFLPFTLIFLSKKKLFLN